MSSSLPLRYYRVEFYLHFVVSYIDISSLNLQAGK